VLVNKIEDMIITGENYKMEFKESVDRDEIIEFFQSEGWIIFDEMVNKKVQLETVLDEGIYENYLKKANISNVLPVSETMI
jgi:predicted HTH transcriptional regulator